MSHTTKISSIAIRDEAAIRAAVATLQARGVKINLKEDAVPRMYFREQEQQVGKCPFVLHLPDSRYDVGLQRQADGTLAPVFDEFANDVHRSVGASCAIPKTAEERAMWAIGGFAQEYAKQAAINSATAQGYYVQSAETDENGNVQLVFSV